MEWSAPDGNVHAATFEDPLSSSLANQRLRTALSIDGEWLTSVLEEAGERLTNVRRTHADAGGLVIATDQEHAKGIADLLRRRFGMSATVVTSDDPTASQRLTAFGADRSEWLVAVRMVSEGVDIPRLRVGVYATTTTTDLFFRQAVGRFVRWLPGLRDQRAWLYLPDDPRLRLRSAEIGEARRHSLRRERRPDEDPREAAPLRDMPPDAGEQMSMFVALSAVPIDDPSAWRPWHEPLPDDWNDGPDRTIEVELAPPPELFRGGDAPAGAGAGTQRELKDRLRAANANAVLDIVRRTGSGHAAVNSQLNRLSGIRRITEATTTQLQERLAHAHRWLDRL
jgi:superfamily II DNA or RNA helicase